MIIRYGCATLRPIEEKDFDLLFSMINDPDIEDMTVGWNWPISKVQQWDFIKHFENDEHHMRLMIELTNKKTIGMMAINDIDWKNRTATIGYKINASFEDRIRGDFFDALVGTYNYLFNELGLNCVYGVRLENNSFSRKSSKCLPIKEEGILRQRIFKNGKYHNLIATSLLRDEFNDFMKSKN